MPFPYADSSGQWWHEGKPVEMFVMTDDEKRAYVEAQIGSVGKLVTPSDCKSDADGIDGSSPSAPTNLPRM
jgi:hypothetical protein